MAIALGGEIGSFLCHAAQGDQGKGGDIVSIIAVKIANVNSP
jgi:hypothetical protein